MRNASIIKDLKTILGFRGVGAALLQLSREDKISGTAFHVFLREIFFYIKNIK